ncbi:hypothetical protein LTR10_020858 [Elasticomyces elasticus]|nr:hypothetical protein LTR10_020858 [Elasticomyces elasticus]KAK5025559.1 hypothetical protein LTR13_010398 [Exophiala sideris]KAK5029832.1 hypothetical protein LTS07_005556 [Exophiala sideris]KAK5178620.1 hypothetical protein LTR44_008991 [Eurotiomycetes sp. CCFEE 6388]
MSNAVYRFEMAKTGRAGCQNTQCKKDGVKIEKGEFRFGTQVMIKEHFTWMWKHWGCVTPGQIANIQSQIGPLDDLDLDADLPAILDGYEELSIEAQEKIKFALQNGHVADEDWKGEPELNRPGMKGINKRTPKAKKAADAEDETAGAAGDETPTKPKAKKSRSKKVKAEDDEDEDDLGSPPPKKKLASRKRKVAEEDEDEEAAEKPKKKSRAKKVKAEPQDADLGSDDPLNAPEIPTKKKGRAKKVKEEDLDNDEDGPPAPKFKAKKVKKVKAEPEANGDVNMEGIAGGAGEQVDLVPAPTAADVKEENHEDKPKAAPKRGSKAKAKKNA